MRIVNHICKGTLTELGSFRNLLRFLITHCCHLITWINYLFQFEILTAEKYIEEQCGKTQLFIRSLSAIKLPFQFLEFWVLVCPQLVRISKVQRSTVALERLLEIWRRSIDKEEEWKNRLVWQREKKEKPTDGVISELERERERERERETL